MKPDARMYQAVLDELGVEPQEARFIDDSACNGKEAAKLGIQSIRMLRDFLQV
ncbi:HAD-IA family hydrolase [Sporolactobacillus shoreicorticis]|uniref:HAD-IA family hydrolase n=1 Tax=Sporolactobacillus shoreicorticis TaxID=1923877 RepID=A0ABW5RZX1_9BACL|nr:HAD-IA family hydrolase [Sporolactobacillus shoreicorticis]MCO7127207.1 HAD-IA family hydrolase [Sporolactobacillus shoreicorticis]